MVRLQFSSGAIVRVVIIQGSVIRRAIIRKAILIGCNCPRTVLKNAPLIFQQLFTGCNASIAVPLCIPLSGNSVNILFMSSNQLGIFSLNIHALMIKGSAETFSTPPLNVCNIRACATLDYLLIHTICKFSDMILVGTLHCGYSLTQREKCPNTEFFWSVFSCSQSKYAM